MKKLASLLIFLCCSNCHTLLQMRYGKKNKIYGGTKSIMNYSPHPHNPFGEIFRYVGYVDLPFSFALDTAVLPLTVPYYYLSRNPYLGFFAAIHNGDIQYVEKQLVSGVSPDVTDDSGRTALMFAASQQQTEIAKLLLNKKADISKQLHGRTALSFAIDAKLNDLRDSLISQGIEVSKQDVLNAFRAYRKNPEQIIPILEAKKTCSEQEFRNWLTKTAYLGSIPVAKVVFAKNCSNSQKAMASGYKPLRKASKNFDVAMLRFLFDKGVRPEEKSNSNLILDAVSVRHNYTRDVTGTDLEKTVRFLSQKKVSAKARKAYTKETALHLALKSKFVTPALITFLLAKGVDLDAKDKDGRTALLNAMQYNRKKSFALLWRRKPNLKVTEGEQSALLMAASSPNVSYLQKVLPRVENVNLRSYRFRTALVGAVVSLRVANCRLLLQQGADPGIQDKDGRDAFAYLQEKKKYLQASSSYTSSKKSIAQKLEKVKEIESLLAKAKN
ncbi:MAG: ankyrin repeat domain-containing protein [Spirochaetota bacterium]